MLIKPNTYVHIRIYITFKKKNIHSICVFDLAKLLIKT